MKRITKLSTRRCTDQAYLDWESLVMARAAVSVTLDGEKVTKCLAADETEGFVVVHCEPEEIGPDDEWWHELGSYTLKKRGTVRINIEGIQ